MCRCTKGVQAVLDTCLAWAAKKEQSHAVACAASAADATASCGKSEAAQCVEPVIRGFIAMGLKRAVGPEVGRYALNPVANYSLKAPDFNPRN